MTKKFLHLKMDSDALLALVSIIAILIFIMILMLMIFSVVFVFIPLNETQQTINSTAKKIDTFIDQIENAISNGQGGNVPIPPGPWIF